MRMNHTRISRLEKQLRAAGEPSILVVKQDLDDKTLFRDGDGSVYTDVELDELGKENVQVVKIVYVEEVLA